MITSILNRVLHKGGRAGGMGTAHGAGTAPGGRTAGGSRDAAIGRGVRSLLRRLR